MPSTAKSLVLLLALGGCGRHHDNNDGLQHDNDSLKTQVADDEVQIDAAKKSEATKAAELDSARAQTNAQAAALAQAKIDAAAQAKKAADAQAAKDAATVADAKAAVAAENTRTADAVSKATKAVSDQDAAAIADAKAKLADADAKVAAAQAQVTKDAEVLKAAQAKDADALKAALASDAAALKATQDKDAETLKATQAKDAADLASAKAAQDAANTQLTALQTANKATVSSQLQFFDGIWVATTPAATVPSGCTLMLHVDAKAAQITRGVICQNGNIETATLTATGGNAVASDVGNSPVESFQLTPASTSCQPGQTSLTAVPTTIGFDLSTADTGDASTQAISSLNGKDFALSSYGFLGQLVHQSDCATIVAASQDPSLAGRIDSTLTQAAQFCQATAQNSGCFTTTGFVAASHH